MEALKNCQKKLSGKLSKVVCLCALFSVFAAVSGCQNTGNSGLTRTSVNHTEWNKGMFDQAVLVEKANRVMYFSGQTAMEAKDGVPFGVVPKFPNDMKAQITDSLASIDALLKMAEMEREDVVHMRMYVTDREAGLKHFGVVLEWLGKAGIAPANTFLVVDSLAFPGMVVEIEVMAVD